MILSSISRDCLRDMDRNLKTPKNNGSKLERGVHNQGFLLCRGVKKIDEITNSTRPRGLP